MTTIATMTAESESGPESSSTAPAPAMEEPPAPANSRNAANRPLLVPVLTTVIGALIAGVFLLAVAGFNTLRNDIQALRTDMNTEIGSLRSEMAGFREDVNARLDAVNAVLLDHTDRLARIETHLDIRPAG